ncbi:hypothetical protein DVH05_017934 [Phytophthora capsici]|nr:hypothetical protein DVH05_017934 [Phytophthora capsici]
MILAPVAISGMEKMELKTNNELVTGIWLYGCELVSTYIDYTQESLKEESKAGKRVFVKNFADFTSAQMIAAQLFVVDEYYMLGISLVASVGVASWLACKYGKDPSEYEAYVVWAGLGFGLGEGLVIEKAEFKTQEEVVGYAFLFLLTLILPVMKKKYKKLEIPPEYKFSYHKTQNGTSSEFPQSPNLPYHVI